VRLIFNDIICNLGRTRHVLRLE